MNEIDDLFFFVGVFGCFGSVRGFFGFLVGVSLGRFFGRVRNAGGFGFLNLGVLRRFGLTGVGYFFGDLIGGRVGSLVRLRVRGNGGLRLDFFLVFLAEFVDLSLDAGLRLAISCVELFGNLFDVVGVAILHDGREHICQLRREVHALLGED